MKCPCPSTTVWDSYATLCNSAKTSMYPTHLLSLYYTKRWPSHNLIYTMDHTFSSHCKKFICACSHLSAHAYGTKFRGRNFKHFKSSTGRVRIGTVSPWLSSWQMDVRRWSKDRDVSTNAGYHGYHRLPWVILPVVWKGYKEPVGYWICHPLNILIFFHDVGAIGKHIIVKPSVRGIYPSTCKYVYLWKQIFTETTRNSGILPKPMLYNCYIWPYSYVLEYKYI